MKRYINFIKKPIIIISIVFLIFISLIKIFLFNNIDFLFFVAQECKRPSASYHYILKKIYEVAEKKEIGKILIDRIKNDQNISLHYHYIRVLGVTGNTNAIGILLIKYVDFLNQKEDNNPGYTLAIVNSIGLVGDKTAATILKKSLEHYNYKWLNPAIAGALFLITGNKYNFLDTSDKFHQFKPRKRSLNAYEIISKTRGKKRSLKEMIELDKIFHPPDH